MRLKASKDHRLSAKKFPAEVNPFTEIGNDAECTPKRMENSKEKLYVQGACLSESVDNLLQWGRERLSELGSCEALLSVERLLGFVTKQDRVNLYLDTEKRLPSDLVDQFKLLVEERRKRVPVARLIGTQAFWEEELEVGPGCLIPRPETEVLVERLLEKIKKFEKKEFSFLDIGAGSGAIGIALLRACPNAMGTLVDISSEAIAITEKNLKRYNLLDQAKAIESDLFNQLGERRWDVIVSNPPYFSKKDWETVEPEVLKDPTVALDGGEDGLVFYRRIACEARKHLTPSGLLAFEVGQGQAQAVSEILESFHYHTLLIYPDYSGIDRVVMATLGH